MQVVQSRVLLRPRDMDRSLAFYESALGLVRYREWGDPPHRGVVFFLGGGFLELAETTTPEAPQGVRLWLQVPDAAAAEQELRAAGVDIAAPAARQPWGLIECVVHDPDGLLLVIVETPIDHPLRRDQR